MEINIVIAGVGGQGVVTAGTLISQAASAAGLNVVMSEIHGLAQRGGSVSVEVRIGDVKSPIIPMGDVDLILGLEPMEGVRAASRAGEKTIMLINTETIAPVSLSMKGEKYPGITDLVAGVSEKHDLRLIDGLKYALEAGDARAVSTVMVGAAMQLGLFPFSQEDMKTALGRRFSGKVLEMNEKALELGKTSLPERFSTA